MPTKRWFMAGLTAWVVLLVSLVGLHLSYSPISVCEDTYVMLREGMTEQEVRAILGEATDTPAAVGEVAYEQLPDGYRIRTWSDGQNHIGVVFNREGRVASMRCCLEDPSQPRPTFAEWLRTKLGW